jgi:glyoxylase-like metal-dependent hydrolase (beta-lactamase superfamily II)
VHHLTLARRPGLLCATLVVVAIVGLLDRWRGQMTGGGVQEIAAGIWCWQRRPRGLRPGEFGARTSYALTAGGETLLIDPLVDGDDDPALPALDNLASGRVRILISKPFHTRSAEPLWHRYRRAKARIYGHPEVATRLGDTSGFEAVTAGTSVGGLARFHPIGSPPRSEQPIEIPAHRALVFGDAVVETGGGELRVWDDPLDSERRRRWWRGRYLPTLEPLAALQIEHVLVTHGQPVLTDGAAALRHALDREPWQRPKR